MGNEGRRYWKLGKQAAFNCYPRSKKEMQKAKKEKQGITLQKIEKILNCCKSFIGCFARDQLENLAITSFPCFLIVNTDRLGGKGLHWISLRISKRTIELFDSGGLVFQNELPIEILSFIQRFTVSRTFKFNTRLQPDNSVLCGFYCICYIFLRQHCSFSQFQKYFSDDLIRNDMIIIKFFK